MPGQVQCIAIESTDTIADCFARRVSLTPAAIAYRRFDPATALRAAVIGGRFHD